MMIEAGTGDLDGVVITQELATRPGRPSDHAGEARVLVGLAEAMANAPGTVLQQLVEAAMELTRADSAGVSLLEPDGEDGAFRWVATAGAWAPYRDGTMPRAASPCGEVIAREAVLLVTRPERAFPALLQADPKINEGLLAPFYVGGVPVGTVWVIKHDPEARFDAEDARLLQSLTRFASAGQQMVVTLDETRAAHAESEGRVSRREAALRKSEERLERALNAAEMGAWELDLVTHDAWRSERHDRIFGYHELQPAWSYETSLQHVLPEDRDEFDRRFRKAVADRSDWGFECRIRRADGEIRWIWAQGQIEIDAADRPLRMKGMVRDITDQKMVELALHESEERQAFLLEFADAIRTLGDPVDIIAAASEALGRHLDAGRCGYGEVDATGEFFTVERDWTDGIMPSFKGRHRLVDFGPQITEAYRAGRSVVIEDALADARAAGAEAAYEAAGGVRSSLGLPLIKEGRFVAGLFVQQLQPRRWTASDEALARDIAERTWAAVERARAEAAQSESEERFRGFADNSADVLWIVNANTMELDYLSPAFEQIWGERREAVMRDLGRWAELVHPDDRERAAHAIERPMAGESHTCTYRIVRPDGAVRWIRDTGFPIHDNGLTRIGGIAQDVTDLKTIESVAADREERLRLIVANARDYAIFTTDIEGVIDDWREGAEIVLGWSAEEAVGQRAEMTFTPEDRAQGVPAKEMQIAREEGGAPNVRWHMRKDGRRVFIEGIMAPLKDADGTLTGFLKIGQDVTDRHHADERQRLLLAELQHRVRNILAMIRSVARRTAETSETAEEFAQHLEGRIDAMARTQAKLTRAPGDPVDLEEIVQSELLSVAAPQEKVWYEGVEVRLEPKAAEVLTLAIHELATNAVKYGAFSQPAGQLEIGWKVEQRDSDRWLIFAWEEARVEGVRASGREGFGTELISRRVPYELGGTGTFDLTQDGLRVVVAFPLRGGGSILETGASGIGEAE